MPSYYSRDEAVGAVSRVLRGVVEGEEAAATIALVEQSLGIPEGAMTALVFYPEHAGASDDLDADGLVELALQRARDD